VGTAIEFWKVTKAFDVSIEPTFPYLSIKDKASYDRHDTKKHDADAIRYLSYALYPLVIGYSVYALLYETHKSWYSWVLGSLVGAVYTFGFILMCPQVREARGGGDRAVQLQQAGKHISTQGCCLPTMPCCCINWLWYALPTICSCRGSTTLRWWLRQC
jgi:hypothetical protein